MGDMKGVDPV